MNEVKLEIGVCVMLKCGGPRMVIDGIWDNAPGCDYRLWRCVWHNDETRQVVRDGFRKEILKAVDD